MTYPPIVIEEITDSTELAEAEAQREQFDRNAAWLQVHASEVYAKFAVIVDRSTNIVSLLGQRHVHRIEEL